MADLEAMTMDLVMPARDSVLEVERQYIMNLLETAALEERYGQRDVRRYLVDTRDLSSMNHAETNEAARSVLDRGLQVGWGEVVGELMRSKKLHVCEYLWEQCFVETPRLTLPSASLLVKRLGSQRRNAEVLASKIAAVERGESIDPEQIRRELEALDEEPTGPMSAADLVRLGLTRYAEMLDAGKARIRTGIAVLDAELGGLDLGSLTVVGARPSVGKSSLALKLATTMELEGVRCTIVSAEDGAETWATRLLALRASVAATTLRMGKSVTRDEFGRLDRTAAEEGESFQLLHKPRGALVDICRALDEYVPKHSSDAVLVDYAQAIRVPGVYDRRQQVDAVISELKAICARLGTHLVLFSQLRRYEGAEPTLQDLKETGTFEEAAENVLLMWRITDPSGDTVYGRLAKNKNGRSGSRFEFGWDAKTASFSDVHNGQHRSTLYDDVPMPEEP